MSDSQPSLRDSKGRYRRVAPAASGPDRRAGGFYRSADGDSGPRRVIGRPMTSTEDAVIAAVRLAYDVADAQVDRSLRIASRLKTAGDAATGTDSDRLALQSVERLALRFGEMALAWIELSAAEPGSPLRRMFAAEYRWLGRLLGLVETTSAPTVAPPAVVTTQAPAAVADVAAPQMDTYASPARGETAVLAAVKGTVSRLVRPRLLAHADLGTGPLNCIFAVQGKPPVKARLRFAADRRAWVLELPDLTAHASATWTGAVLDAERVQLAVVHLDLL